MSTLAFVQSLPPWAVLGAGYFAGTLRSAWSFIYKNTIGYAISKFSLTLAVEDTEYQEAYEMMSEWVESKLKERRVNSLLLRRNYRTEDDRDLLIPNYGTYYMRRGKWRPMTISHTLKEGGDGRKPIRTVKINIPFSRDRNTLLGIIEEAKQYTASKNKQVNYFTGDTYGDWAKKPVPTRELSSVYMPKAIIESILSDIRVFISEKQKYDDLGVPHRRGYLLYGPPGTGKSTLILAIASHFNLPVYCLKLNGGSITGERISSMMSSCAKPCIVLAEDIDCLKIATTRESELKDGATLSDLLNAIDGVGASHGRMLFVTANKPENIDYALLRAGRIDRKFHIDYAKDEELKVFYEKASSHFAIPSWEEFRKALPENATIADAQAIVFSGQQDNCRFDCSVKMVDI